ncbi:MAG: HesA/MoeB/ThiF family protein [Anaerolineales bacterium]|nr:HesA/MoeB/ThiF family protein [Anaerolineales bacterium]
MSRLSDPPDPPMLSPDDRSRFARHLRLPEVGEAGQARLRAASVLVVGAGGLGSSALLHLAASGVGRIGIVDPDTVHIDNLHRQILYAMPDVGHPKVQSARGRLVGINPQTILDMHPVTFDAVNADDLARPYQIIVDGSDNLAARKVINRVCVRQGKPMVYGSAQRFEGVVGVFDARRGPCFRCIFSDPADPGAAGSPSGTGVFGPLPGIIGTLQALAAMKIILEIGDSLYERLMTFDGLSGEFTPIKIRKKPQCSECGSTVEKAPHK